jgi:predicted small integral membrane protein
MTDAFLDGLFWSLIVSEALLGSVLLIGGIGWLIGKTAEKVDAMIGEIADHE